MVPEWDTLTHGASHAQGLGGGGARRAREYKGRWYVLLHQQAVSQAGTYRRGKLDAFGIRSTENLFQRYTEAALGRLGRLDWPEEMGPPPTVRSVEAADRILRSIGRAKSVYPTIAADGDGGIDVLWKADDRLLRIWIDEDGESHAWLPEGFGLPSGRIEVTDPQLKVLREALFQFSRFVEEANPDWRRWFVE